ncbi:MAG: GNAT family N-acetyltransferase [Anaerolineales bacterium]|nr:GNAT family N-acetyltransferase [Anaerolineales bacterium]
MPAFTLRTARESDSSQIKELIYLAGINPMSLDWKRFVVAVDTEDRIVGTGQIKPHGKEILELASIAVHPSSRGRGIARAVIERLLKDSPRPLYLTCVSAMGSLYKKFGFVSISEEEMPRYYQRLSKLANAMMTFTHKGERLLVMKLK